MTNQRTKIVVLGGSGFLGTEICRIARSMGHEVVSISKHGRPDIDERWLHGITWVEADVMAPADWTDHLEGAEALIDCIGDPGSNEAGDARSIDAAVRVVAEAAEGSRVEKLVYVSSCDDTSAASPPASTADPRRAAQQRLESGPVAHAVLQLDVIDGGDHADSPITAAAEDRVPEDGDAQDAADERGGVRREKVAICALRAALEADIAGLLDRDRIAYLGDAMFIQ